MPDDRFATGMKVRRGVLGDAHVDAADERTTAFDALLRTRAERPACADALIDRVLRAGRGGA